ncbi:MAG: ArsB/NhaD family transporter [Candidatus Margulisiibacteriota bacterium]
MLLLASLILIIAYIAIAWELTPKVTAAMLGASVMLLIHRIPAKNVFAHIDFAVIFLLIGMMIIVHITSRSGVFNWLGIVILRRTKGNPKTILVAMAVLTAFLSAFLDNVTTVVLMLPIIYNLTDRLKINPIPFLITIILTSNIGGTATLIGDPPNILIGTAANLSFMDFLLELTPVIFCVFVVSTLFLLFYYRHDLQSKQEYQTLLNDLSSEGIITDKGLMFRSLGILFIVISGFMLHDLLHIDAYVWALLGASILLLGEKPKEIMNEVEWSTIFFFIGLFIIIGGFAEAGGVKFLSKSVLGITQGNQQATTFLILWASGLFSAVIDNIPYTITMIPLIKELQSVMDITPLWWSLSLGACLGGNATIVGAAANVIVTESSQHKGYPITFMTFMKIGVMVTFLSLVISSLYLFLRFFL